jgi:hypothetical protein
MGRWVISVNRPILEQGNVVANKALIPPVVVDILN